MFCRSDMMQFRNEKRPAILRQRAVRAYRRRSSAILGGLLLPLARAFSRASRFLRPAAKAAAADSAIFGTFTRCLFAATSTRCPSTLI